MKRTIALLVTKTASITGVGSAEADRIVLYLDNPSRSEEQEVGGALDDGSRAIKNAIQGGLRDENRPDRYRFFNSLPPGTAPD